MARSNYALISALYADKSRGLYSGNYSGAPDLPVNRGWREVKKMRARDPLTRQRLTPVRDFRLTPVA